MTTETLTETQIEYEPSVQDKIQRVLYRLDQGEKLIARNLKEHDNYCILGLFVDESGLGEWQSQAELLDMPYEELQSYQYNIDNDIDVSGLFNDTLTKYYNFKDYAGSFNFYDLPESVQNKIEAVARIIIRDGNYMMILDDLNLYTVNDILVESNYDPKSINEILADIIRSGVIFKEPCNANQ